MVVTGATATSGAFASVPLGAFVGDTTTIVTVVALVDVAEGLIAVVYECALKSAPVLQQE
jgi:hypothetical protein